MPTLIVQVHSFSRRDVISMNQDETTDEALKADDSQIEVESPATEEEPTDVQGEEVEVSEESDELPEGQPESTDEESSDDAPESEGRKTANSRIRQLVSEKKEAEQRAESMADRMEQMTRQFKPQAPQRMPDLAPGQTEMTYEEIMQRADTLAQMRIAQSENLARINNESKEAIKAHPQLDPSSDSFDPDLSESISQATLAYAQSNPTGSVTKFVDGLMKPFERAVEKQSVSQKETIAKQVSKQTTRPTQVQQQEKSFADLSLEEMEAKLGVAHR